MALTPAAGGIFDLSVSQKERGPPGPHFHVIASEALHRMVQGGQTALLQAGRASGKRSNPWR